MVVVLGSWGLWQRDNETNETKLENMPVLELPEEHAGGVVNNPVGRVTPKWTKNDQPELAS